MKAIILIIIILCSMVFGACCQTFSEWWRQKKTRIKYLRQQEAVLEALEQTTEDGYTEAVEGVDSIASITDEEFAGHQQFLLSLRLIKPIFKEGPEQGSCYAMVAALSKKINEWIAVGFADTALSFQEKQWISGDLAILITYLKDDLQQLELLTQDGNLEMEEDARYKGIIEAESEIRSGCRSGVLFLQRVMELISMRKQEKANETYLKNILK